MAVAVEKWKPDFTKLNPYEGMPPEYAERVAKTFIPTLEQPYSPIVRGIQQGQISTEFTPKFIPPVPDPVIPIPPAPAPIPTGLILIPDTDYTLNEDYSLLYKEYQRTGGQLDVTNWINAGTPIRPEYEYGEELSILGEVYAKYPGYKISDVPIKLAELQQWAFTDTEGFLEDLRLRTTPENVERVFSMLGITQETVLASLPETKQIQRITETIQTVFPDYSIEDFSYLLENEFDTFIKEIQTYPAGGATRVERRQLLEMLGIAPDEINQILSYQRQNVWIDGNAKLLTINIETQQAFNENGDYVGRYNSATHQFTKAPDKTILKNIWDTLSFSTNQYSENVWAGVFGAVLPMLYPDMPEGFMGSFGEEITRQNRQMREEFRWIYSQMKTDYDVWFEKHPEIRPSTAYLEGAFQNPALLKDPNYWAYEITNMLPLVLTSIVMTVATGGTGTTFLLLSTMGMGAVEGGAVYQDLINAGAPVDKAAPMAIIAGGIIGGLESVGRIPLLKQVSPALFGLFKRNAASALAKRSFAETIKRFGRNFTIAQFSEVTTEIAQEIVGNVAVGFFDENRSAFANIGDIAVKTAVATVPFALLGGATSISMVTSNELSGLSNAARIAKGWVTDNKGNWFEVLAGEEGAIIPGAEPGGIIPVTPEVTIPLTNEAVIQRGKDLDPLLKEVEAFSAEESLIKEQLVGIKKRLAIVGISPVLDKQLEQEVIDLTMAFNKVESQKSAARVKFEDATIEWNRQWQKTASKLAIPKAEVGMPEAGYQPAMIEGVTEKVVRPVGKGVVTQISMEDQLKLQQARQAAVEAPAEVKEAYEAQAEIEGLRFTHETDPVAQARFKLGGRNVDLTAFISIREQNFPEYFTIKQAQAIKPNINLTPYTQKGTPLYNHIPKGDVLDELGDKWGMTEDEIANRVMAIRKERQQIKALESKITTQMTEKPLASLPELTTAEVTENWAIIGQPKLNLKQIDALSGVFAGYINDPNIVTAWELTRELRRETLSGRAENLKARAQELIVQEGITTEEAMKQAIRETLAGELPAITTEYFEEITNELRDAFFAKVAIVLKDEPFEMASTFTALTNALTGKPIPREPGVKGGSAFTRLQRVFGDQPKVLKAIDKMATEKKPLQDVVEGIYHETGRAPIPIDQETADYLRGLKPDVLYEPTVFRAPIPVTKFEAPIEGAFKQKPLTGMTFMEQRTIVRVLKELGMLPVDIGNLVRANLASFDFSFWRQVKTITPAHPVAFYRANIEAWKAMLSQKSAEANWLKITRDPLYQIYEEVAEKGKDFLRPLELKKGTSQWKGVEEYGYLTGERLLPRLTQKIPWVKISARSFVTGTNEMTWQVFKTHYKAMLRYSEKIASGEIKLKEGEAFDMVKEMTDMAGMIADFTQRASLGKAAPLAPALSSMFFAPRSKLGRILTPRHLVSANPRVRVEAWKDLSLFVGVIGGLVMLGDWLDLWDVETDPRSAEWMSIRIGNLRIDPWAGNRQIVVFYARVISGTGVSSVTGAEYEVNPISAMTNFIRSSLAPFSSIMLDFWTGKNFLGEKVDVANKKQWAERLAPFSVQNIWEAFEEDWKEGVISILPAWVGEGVQTYTGDWKENFTKLGLPKYLDNLAYGMTEPKYDTQDFWSDTASQFKGVDPATLTKAKGYPEYIKAIAEARIINEHLSTLPSDRLVSLNADPVKGTTFAQYYQMWRDREKIVASGDDEALKAFDADERTKNAEKGNFSQRQFALLNEYWSITDPKKQEEFLELHETEIGVKPRDEYLRTHPAENAQLAVWGQADILTKEAYNQFLGLLKTLDIPDSAVPPMTLPPEGSIDTHFTYKDRVSEGTHGSWEAQLLLKQDALTAKEADVQSYADWAGLTLSDTPLASLELKVKNRELFDTLNSYSDKDSPDYIADEKARADAVAKLKADNPEFVDDIRRIEAIEVGTDEAPTDNTIIDAWVDRGHTIDQFTAGSSEAKVWLLDHPDAFQWALDNELLTDDGKDWNESVLRINATWREQDEAYDALSTTGTARADYLTANVDYRIARRQRDFYNLDIPQATDTLRDKYVGFYEVSDKGYVREHYLLDNPDLYAILTDPEIMGDSVRSTIDPTKIPDKRYDEIYTQFQDLFDEWDSYGQGTSPNYIADEDDRAVAREGLVLRNPSFQRAVWERNAYLLFIGQEKFVPDYVDYQEIIAKGKPPDANYWFDDDWYLMEHPEFYKAMTDLYIKTEGKQGWKPGERNFSKVPPRDIYEEYLVYDAIIGSATMSQRAARFEFRRTHPSLDAWLVLIGAVSQTMVEYDHDAGMTTAEKFARDMVAMRAKIDRLRAEIDEKLKAMQ